MIKPAKTILCMDDDLMILEIMQDYFQQSGYRVLIAENGENGLALFDGNRVDAVFVDLKMPVVNGFQVLEKMSRTYPGTPVIVISGEGEMADVIQALHLGAWHYLIKPIESWDIVEHALRQALEKADLILQNEAYQQGLEVKLKTIIEHFPGFVLTCTPDHIITYTNSRLSEYTDRDLRGESCKSVICGQGTACQWEPETLCSSGEFVQHELQISQDGRWYDLTCLPVCDQAGQIVEYQMVLIDITEQKQKLQDAQDREQLLLEENSRLMESLSDRYRFGDIIGKSKEMQEVYKTILKAAGSDASVVIYGETGTGKELVAQAIHNNSKRKNRPFIAVNCGAIPENLIESEFFGYKKGAFSGAVKDKYGVLDLADGGSLFLDEVGDIPLHLQIKLLRAVEGGGFTPLGGTEVKRPDVRIISATNRNLPELVKQGAMRQDFLYRIHVISILLPPLRERKEDIRLLIEHFFALYDLDGTMSLPPQIRSALLNHRWPGNVRELQNTIHRYITLGELDFIDLSPDTGNQSALFDAMALPDRGLSLAGMLEEVEKRIILQQFEKNNWHQNETAAALQVDRKTLYRKIKQYNIAKPE